MCRDLTSLNNKVSMGVTPIKIITRTKTKAKVGVIIRAIKTMDEGIIRTVCHHPK